MGQTPVVIVAAIDTTALALAVAAGYVIGSIPTAVLVGRVRGVDPRLVGDRNPGYWNVKEQLGRAASVPVFVGDAGKGAVAGAIGLALDTSAWGIAYAAVAAAMIGHAYPVFARFVGGRSVLTFVGGAAVLSPVVAAVAAGALLAVWAATRSFAWGARTAVFGFPAAQLAFQSKERVAATGALMTIIGIRFVQAAIAERRRAGQA